MKEHSEYRQFGVPEERSLATRIFSGAQVADLPLTFRRQFAMDISAKLATKPTTMLQWTPEDLEQSMDEGRTALITAAANPRQLLAFAQVWNYPYDLFSYIPYSAGFGEKERTVQEVGTWLNFSLPGQGKGLGYQVFKEAIAAGRRYDPDAMQIGIIEQYNVRAQHVIKQLGGELIGSKPSPVLKNMHGEPSQMYIYLLKEAHAILQP